MGQIWDVDFFSNLPTELMIDILSRLPVETIMNCKRVCKSWLDLIETHEFAKFHRSKSVPALAVIENQKQSCLFSLFESEDRLDLEHPDLDYNPIAKLRFPFIAPINGSVDGLLFSCGMNTDIDFPLYVCNPITREYIKFQYPQDDQCTRFHQVVTYGFGVSKKSRLHKVVRILHRRPDCGQLRVITKLECQVYTLETGSCRSIAHGPLFNYFTSYTQGALLNGNLHWLVNDLNYCSWISCFDLEAEVFSTFSPPTLDPTVQRHQEYYTNVVALRDHLFLGYRSHYYNGIVIWSMEQYGVEESWTKKFVIRISSPAPHLCANIRPFKVFKDGYILTTYLNSYLIRYSEKDKAYTRIGKFGMSARVILHTPSFVSLKSFVLENVKSI